MNAFDKTLKEHGEQALHGDGLRMLQVNLGFRCNLSCRHCHVGGGPQRPEVMSWSIMESVLRLAESFPGVLVDITGGAPELNPNFKRFVTTLRRQGHPVQVRTNLTVFFEPEMGDLPSFYRDNAIALVASLPCYLDENVRAQRGEGVLEKSTEAIGQLNRLGYGREPELPLNLVYNPGGPFLPPDQASLEAAYRRELEERHQVTFTRLLTIANMPIGRFLADLQRQGKDAAYRALLVESFNPLTVEGLMCRHQICIAWDGTLADCDFNMALGIGLGGGMPHHIDELDAARIADRPIATGEHCFGCTAGSGSSCGGALVA